MERFVSIAALVGITVLGGCGHSSSASVPGTAPTLVTTPVAQQPALPAHISGKVTDRSGTALSGVLIEILDGAARGRTALTDQSGTFEFAAAAADLAQVCVPIRASGEGLQPRIIQQCWYTVGAEPDQVIWLDAGPPVVLQPRAYTLTTRFDMADAASPVPETPCDGFPTEVSSHTFPAMVRTSTTARDQGFRLVDLGGLRGFGLTIVGRFVEFEFDSPLEGGVPGLGNLQVTGWAPTMEPVIVSGSSVAIPFHGNFSFCPVNASDSNIRCHRCMTDHAVMIFTPR